MDCGLRGPTERSCCRRTCGAGRHAVQPSASPPHARPRWPRYATPSWPPTSQPTAFCPPPCILPASTPRSLGPGQRRRALPRLQRDADHRAGGAAGAAARRAARLPALFGVPAAALLEPRPPAAVRLCRTCMHHLLPTSCLVGWAWLHPFWRAARGALGLCVDAGQHCVSSRACVAFYLAADCSRVVHPLSVVLHQCSTSFCRPSAAAIVKELRGELQQQLRPAAPKPAD